MPIVFRHPARARALASYLALFAQACAGAPKTAPPNVPPLAAADANAARASAPLSLDAVLAIAMASNPSFAEFEASRMAAQAEVMQALAYPNPEIELSAGRATAREEPQEEELEYGVSLVQPIEMPSKRRTRRRAAEAGVKIVEREADLFALSLHAETSKAFAAVIHAQRAAELALKGEDIAKEIGRIAGRRAALGEAPEMDRIKARVEILKTSRNARAAARRIATARAVLNAWCGGALPSDFQLEAGADATLRNIDFKELKQTALRDHARLRKLHAELARQEAVIAREKSAWHPDLKPGIEAGREMDADSLGVTLAVELPLWNRNRGGIRAAEAERAAAQARIESAQIEIARDVETAGEEYESAREQLEAFEMGLRESAAEALKIETLLYEQGETDFTRLLEARRTAQDAEFEFIQAIHDARAASINLEYAVGQTGGGKK